MWKRWRRRLAVILPVTVVVAYFAYHALYGRLGVFAWRELQAELVDVEAQLARASAENLALEGQIRGLRPETLDVDAVETVLRDYGYVRPDERVVLGPR